ncbi:woronin body major protein [Emericellopsis atlantica]|uniref:Woronin body major protein n=1 Tax=Emericellopsis atlantica TaxID=2614577 RepID=A0A9P7ZVB0_9HYPO|nr:woronin body major protein [Emericellopsis atlantica]KAG9258731.1 woronin body major protein [Emericellopsis atlantica]
MITDSLAPPPAVNLDFEARVPVPFSIFPSTYKDSEAQTATVETHQEVEVKLPEPKAGREGQHSSSFTANVDLPQQPEQQEHRFGNEEVHYRQEEHYHRPGTQHEHFAYEERRPAAPRTNYTNTHIEVDAAAPAAAQAFTSPIDVAERQYRERYTRPQFNVTVDGPGRATYQSGTTTNVNNFTVDARVPGSAPKVDSKFISDETVEPARYSTAHQKSKMGYYDEDGHYHSFRQGVHKLADRIVHPRGHEHHHHVDVDVHQSAGRPRPGDSAESYLPNTVTIPCHHIRLGDFLMLQGRPCQVIRISTSSATGQYRYLGVDLFTKQLHEESSFVSNPAPSVVVQTMLGPVFKQYRVLDLQDGLVVAMTETGDVKHGLPVIDQSNLSGRLANAFESGRGSVRVLVLNDNGQELAVDMKVMHGSRL